jgi:hypothetical protein
MKKKLVNEEILRIQKLAGIIKEGKYVKSSDNINEGFLDDIVSRMKGSSQQGKLLKNLLAKLGITKNPFEIYGITASMDYEPNLDLQAFLYSGGDIRTKIPFSKEYKEVVGGSIIKSKIVVNYNRDIPTIKRTEFSVWDIVKGKWIPANDNELNQEQPITIENMKDFDDPEIGSFVTKVTMMTIEDAVKVWHRNSEYGKKIRRVLGYMNSKNITKMTPNDAEESKKA